MGRYADVDYLLKNNAVKMDWSDQKWVSEVSLVSAINPNVVQIVHGHWISSEIDGFDRCSNCKALWDVSLTKRNIFFRLCPRCGAMMDEKKLIHKEK